MIYLPPSALIFQSSSGIANMGVVTSKTSPARFGLADVRWVLAWLRVHFTDASGSASSTLATMKLFVDSRLHPWYDAELAILQGSGTGFGKNNDAFVRVTPDEYVHWTFEAGDELVVTWTNPDPDDLAWAIEAAVAPASAVIG